MKKLKRMSIADFESFKTQSLKHLKGGWTITGSGASGGRSWVDIEHNGCSSCGVPFPHGGDDGGEDTAL